MAIDSKIFDLLDDWRHLPDYQLERRADIFFAAYLPGFLTDHFGIDIDPKLIPEFPVRRGVLNENITQHHSCKVDYLAIAPANRAVFIELKTDPLSRRAAQNNDLEKISDLPLSELVSGVLELAKASQQTYKYCHLLRLLKHHKLVTLPSELDAVVPDASIGFRATVRKHLKSVNAIPSDLTVTAIHLIPKLRPDSAKPIKASIIVFDTLAAWLMQKRPADSIAQRFATSLKDWAGNDAGCPAVFAPPLY